MKAVGYRQSLPITEADSLIDVELPDKTGDEEYLRALDAVLDAGVGRGKDSELQNLQSDLSDLKEEIAEFANSRDPEDIDMVKDLRAEAAELRKKIDGLKAVKSK